MIYKNNVQARIITNHGHDYGTEKQDSYFKIEGTKGALKIRLGVSIDYPRGVPDLFEYILEGEKKWKSLEINGSWFPDAFIGSMTNFQNFLNDKNTSSTTLLEGALDTMKIVELTYQSSENGGIKF